jgi:NadR type nicotinamide-nucleotide adenylyltransferase
VPHAVVVTGPESTGKTTLALTLARAYDAPCSPEYSRIYYDERLAADPRATLDARDVEPIARGQIAVEDAARAVAAVRGASCVVHDTDLVSTVVYARHYYGACPAWIVDAARARRAALYLLCVPDVPWIPDAQRDRPAQRDALFDEFRATLDALGCPILEIRGVWALRDARALDAVRALTTAWR